MGRQARIVVSCGFDRYRTSAVSAPSRPIRLVILHPQSEPEGEQKRHDDADEHSGVAGPVEALHFVFALGLRQRIQACEHIFPFRGIGS